MSIGSGIFCSGLLIASVILFAMTRDRWDWKKIGFRFAAAFVLICVLLYVWYWNSNRPRVQTTYYGVSIGETKDDVRFKKGNSAHSDTDAWDYDLRTTTQSGFLIVMFKNGHVRAVEAVRLDQYFFADYINGVGIGTSGDTLIANFGNQFDTSVFENNLERLYSFPKYHMFFNLEKNEVTALGVYDPTTGPMRFAKERKPTFENNIPSGKPKPQPDPLSLGKDNPALKACLNSVDPKDPLGILSNDPEKDKQRQACIQKYNPAK